MQAAQVVISDNQHPQLKVGAEDVLLKDNPSVKNPLLLLWVSQ